MSLEAYPRYSNLAIDVRLRTRLLTMLGVPAIRTSAVVRESCLQAFKSHVSTAHDGLSHVVEAVRHVPFVSFWHFTTRRPRRVCSHDRILLHQISRRVDTAKRASYQTVQLMSC